ncbi:hypothetical protein BC629DRAFT_221790 [Irpex lacteus]|nr:hypothetical protein BC629DRAFT_221790 [Irpex lacteus]
MKSLHPLSGKRPDQPVCPNYRRMALMASNGHIIDGCARRRYYIKDTPSHTDTAMTLMECFFDVSHLFRATDAGHPTVEIKPASVAYRDINALPLELTSRFATHSIIASAIIVTGKPYSAHARSSTGSGEGCISLLCTKWSCFHQAAITSCITMPSVSQNVAAFTLHLSTSSSSTFISTLFVLGGPWIVQNFILVCGERIRTSPCTEYPFLP